MSLQVYRPAPLLSIVYLFSGVPAGIESFIHERSQQQQQPKQKHRASLVCGLAAGVRWSKFALSMVTLIMRTLSLFALCIAIFVNVYIYVFHEPGFILVTNVYGSRFSLNLPKTAENGLP
jgi:uncharacterized membrane protein